MVIERALRKSMRASIRGANNVSRFLLTSQRSAAPPQCIPIASAERLSSTTLLPSVQSGAASTTASILSSDLATASQVQQQAQEQEQGQRQEEVTSGPDAKKMIQHFDTLSRLSKVAPVRTSTQPLKRLGMSSNGGPALSATHHRLLHQHRATPSPPVGSVSKHLLGTATSSLGPALTKSRGILTDRKLGATSFAGIATSGKPDGNDLIVQQRSMLSHPQQLQQQQSRRPFSFSSTMDKGRMYSMQHDGHSKGLDATIHKTGTLEELYFRQAQVMQWCLVLSKADVHFESVKATAEKYIQQQEMELVETSKRHEELSTQLTKEKELIALETTFGPVRDKLCRVSSELDEIKMALRQYADTADTNGHVEATGDSGQGSGQTTVAVDRKRLLDLEKTTSECLRIAQDAMSQSTQGSNIISQIGHQVQKACTGYQEQISLLQNCLALCTAT